MVCWRMNRSSVLVIIVPCYNEEEVIRLTAEKLKTVLHELVRAGKIAADSYICFVDDGSSDDTWGMITDLNREFPECKGLKLSKNFGHQSALLTALYELDADLYISIDADLQDDERKIIDMVDLAGEGNDIVYGVRATRTTDSLLKKNLALLFYKLMTILGTKSVYNHADYRLMSRRAVMELRRYKESNVYLRGIVAELGFKTAKIYYDRKEREYGKSKYPLIKSWKLAWDGITSFSSSPLKFASLLGFLTCMGGILLIAYSLHSWWVGKAVSGWTSILIVIIFFSGIQMLLLGVIGEYIGKIFIESKRRPLYIIEENLCGKGGGTEENR